MVFYSDFDYPIGFAGFLCLGRNISLWPCHGRPFRVRFNRVCCFAFSKMAFCRDDSFVGASQAQMLGDTLGTSLIDRPCPGGSETKRIQEHKATDSVMLTKVRC